MAVDFSAPAIRTDRQAKRFGDVLAFDGLDLTVGRGEVIGFLARTARGTRPRSACLCTRCIPLPGARVLGIPVQDVAQAWAPATEG